VPAKDNQHDIVVRCLEKSGWTILREHYLISVASNVVPARRMYLDLQAESSSAQIVLLEVKGLEYSPVHEFMELIGQYLVYRGALDYLNDDTPLYVAVTKDAYQDVIQDQLAQQVLQKLPKTIPFLIYDPIEEEILRWTPPL
jgi:hypothetical protein